MLCDGFSPGEKVPEVFLVRGKREIREFILPAAFSETIVSLGLSNKATLFQEGPIQLTSVSGIQLFGT